MSFHYKYLEMSLYQRHVSDEFYFHHWFFFNRTIAQVIGNDQIPEEFKKRLETAERNGWSGSNCGELYQCEDDTPETVGN